MVFNGRPDFSEKRIRKRWYSSDALIENDFIDAVKRKEDRRRLDSTLLALCNVIHPILERVEINSPNGHPVCGKFQETAEEPFPGTVQIHDDDRVQFHRSDAADR